MTSGLVDVAGDQAERLTTQASAMGPGELTRAAEVIAKGLTDMRGTTAPRLYLELMGARVLLPGADVGGRGVHGEDRVLRQGRPHQKQPQGEEGRDKAKSREYLPVWPIRRSCRLPNAHAQSPQSNP